MDHSKRDYPMLEYCSIRLGSSSENPNEPIRLPNDIVAWYQQQQPLPKPYDFALEHEVLSKKQDRDMEYNEICKADSREELQRHLVARMKSVTNATEDVCVSYLENHSYDLKTSIEAFLSK